MIISCNCVVCYIGGCPRLLRSDRGTENARISFLQPFLRRHGQDSLAGENSYRYGKSVYNHICINLSAYIHCDCVHTKISISFQRVEVWWSSLKKWCLQWWINFFKANVQYNSLLNVITYNHAHILFI